jgi:hypothetical protein
MSDFMLVPTPAGPVKLAGQYIGDVFYLTYLPMTDGAPMSIDNPLIVGAHRSDVATVHSLAPVITIPQTVLPANTHRHFAYFYNNTSQDVYIKYGSGASLLSFTLKLIAGGQYVMAGFEVYTGIITACWKQAATGLLQTTEGE